MDDKLKEMVRYGGDGVDIRLYNTIVASITPRTITLNTGGWSTVTTKRRMNQAAQEFRLGYYVYQHNWDWYAHYKGQDYRFHHGQCVLHRIPTNLLEGESHA